MVVNFTYFLLLNLPIIVYGSRNRLELRGHGAGEAFNRIVNSSDGYLCLGLGIRYRGNLQPDSFKSSAAQVAARYPANLGAGSKSAAFLPPQELAADKSFRLLPLAPRDHS